MKTNIEPLRKWFGFSRRERRSSVILLFIIMLTYGIRYLVPRSAIEVEELSSAGLSAVLADGRESDSITLTSKPYIKKKDITGKASRWKINNPVRKDSMAGTEARHYQANRKIIELNAADSALLESLPGIGPVLSVRTIKYRELLGGFCSVDQMKEVYGLSEDTFILIEKRLRVDTLKIRKIDVNTADFGRLIRHPYLEKYDVAAILKYRELKGKISGMNDLIDNKLLTSEKAVRIQPYLRFE